MKSSFQLSPKRSQALPAPTRLMSTATSRFQKTTHSDNQNIILKCCLSVMMRSRAWWKPRLVSNVTKVTWKTKEWRRLQLKSTNTDKTQRRTPSTSIFWSILMKLASLSRDLAEASKEHSVKPEFRKKVLTCTLSHLPIQRRSNFTAPRVDLDSTSNQPKPLL